MSSAKRDPYAFVFRGLLTEEALDKSGRNASQRFSSAEEERISKRLSSHLLNEEYFNLSKRMAVVYSVIIAFENSVREFISKRMVETKGASWWSNCVNERVQRTAESRMKDETKVRWHTPRGEAPIYFIEFGDLVTIIERNWTEFEDHFQELDWVKNVLKTIERSRNVIMHGGQLGDADIERVGASIRDWVHQIGS